MTDQPPQQHERAAIPILMVGAFVGAYAPSHRYRRERAVGPVSNLDSRQAMAVARVANIVGIIAMSMFIGYYVCALWSP
jgi:hypothetical protein